MLKKSALVIAALTLSACGSDNLPVNHSAASAAAAQTVGNANQSSLGEEATTVGAADTGLTVGPTDAETIPADAGAPEAVSPVSPSVTAVSEAACPTIDGSFVLTIGGEIRDRLTIHTRVEGGKFSYSFNNGDFYPTQNQVVTNGQGALARVYCERDTVRLHYRDSSGERSGRLELVALSDEEIKVTNEDGSIAMSGVYVSAR